MDVQIRALERKDYGKVIDFAIEGMHFDRYVENRLVLRLYGRYFLYLELARATQVLAAYLGDRLVGILMADMKEGTRLHRSFWRGLYVKLVEAVMAIAVKGGSNVYDSTNKAMLDELLKKASPDGEICFFAADPSVQGRGIGSRLLDELSLREEGRLIYLYTDDNCTFQFYEHKGFERSAEKEIAMEIGGRTVPLTCLLYSRWL